MVAICVYGTSTASTLQNSDFSSFAGWSGEILNSSFLTWDPVNPATDSHFSLLGGGFARLSNDFDYYGVRLFQEFDIPALATTLSFDYSWDKTHSWDLIQASLLTSFPFPDDLLDLFGEPPDFFDPLTKNGSVAADISALAGETVILEFILEDGDLNEADIFSIGNIQINVIPEPGTFFLFGTGLLLLARFGRRKSIVS